MIISVEFGCQISRKQIVDRSVSAHVVCGFARSPGPFSLFLHAGSKCILIHGISLFFQDLFCQIQRESIGVVQSERILSVQHPAAGVKHLLLKVRQDGQSLIDRAVKVFLLLGEHFEDKLTLLAKLRVPVL